MDTKEQLKELSIALTFAADFKDYFRQILEFIKKMKTENKDEMMAMMTALKRMFDQMSNEMKQGNMENMDGKKKEMMDYCMKEMRTLMAEHKSRMTEMDNKMAEMDANMPNPDLMASEASKMAVSEVLSSLPPKDDLKNEISKLGDLIADAISGIIEVDDIKGLKDLLEELKNRPTRLGGGGFSKIAMDGHIVDDETPSGTVNGVNKTFTIAHAPNPTASLKVFVNGQRLRLTEDYTLSGKTITLNTAPPTNSVILVDYRI